MNGQTTEKFIEPVSVRNILITVKHTQQRNLLFPDTFRSQFDNNLYFGAVKKDIYYANWQTI